MITLSLSITLSPWLAKLEGRGLAGTGLRSKGQSLVRPMEMGQKASLSEWDPQYLHYNTRAMIVKTAGNGNTPKGATLTRTSTSV